ncbi:MAG: MurR/RpiR family transcriptional regulator [Anaerococcus sp.]|nr:MurR/RpiR family transcriptional regulator [Anaerococcus sp.]
MVYYIKSVVEIIESKYEDFTAVERTIGDFFIHNEENKNLSSKEISKKLFVSEASLSRFAQKCGFRGYREFIYQYSQNFVEKQEYITDKVSQILKTYQELLNKTYSLVDENQLDRIVKYIEKKDKVFVCGKGSSGLAANEMELRFMRIGVNIDSITDSDQMKMRSVFQDKKDLVIGMSLSASTEDIIYFLEKAHKKGARTVLITSQLKEDHKKFCDEIVLVPSLRHLNHGNVISPQFPISLMVDLIYAHYVRQNSKEKEQMHGDTLKALGNAIEEER